LAVNARRREGRSGPAGIGTRGAPLREARDLTQEELADRAGLHPNYIGRIERGESNVGVKALFKLTRGLGVEPAALFER
jgi:transcriptional regulator with XRE-family HTH domain